MLCLLNREVVEQHRSDVLSEDCFELFQRVELDRAGNSGVAAPTAAAGAPQTHLPRAIGLFRHLDSAISLKFLTCQDHADWLTPKRLSAWLASMGYPGRTDPATMHARLSAAPRGAARR
jgi:transposase